MNDTKGNGGKEYKFNIPVPIIVLAYFCSPPVGVILTLLKIFLPDKVKFDTGRSANRRRHPAVEKASSTASTQSEKDKVEAAEKTGGKKGDQKISVERVLSIVFAVAAAAFCLCGVINGVETLVDAFGTYKWMGAVRSVLFGDTLILEVLAAASFIASRVFRNIHDRFMRVRTIVGNREQLSLSKLAAMAGISVKKAKSTMQKLINRGVFGEEAYLDLEKGTFMRHPAPEEEKPKADENTDSAFDLESAEQEKNYRAIILEIRRLNDEIRDFAVSERIYRIEEHTQNIFDYVTEHPEAKGQIRTFMNYYLPTTLKLLESYSRIEKVGVAGENMKKSKENIENILDMLVVGFEQQVDQLFRNESMDIDSEISVLETMMKQDGLSGKNDFAPVAEEPKAKTASVDMDFGGMAAQTAPEDSDNP